MGEISEGSVKGKKEPRRHHYIPEFYLANFTPTGEKDDFLWVLDKKQAKQWKAIPKNVAHQRDFYRISAEDLKATEVEGILSEIEGEASLVIRNVIEKLRLPDDDKEFAILMDFIALMATRIPGVRNSISKIFDDVYRDYLHTVTDTPERWKSIISKLKEENPKIKSKVSYADMKKFVDEDQYKVDTPPGYHLENMFQWANSILPYLVYRKWSLIMIENNENKFICSDNPIGLSWIDPPSPSYPYPPGFAAKNSLVTFPISRNVAIIGCFEGHAHIEVSDESIAYLNSMTANGARFIFSAEEIFI